MFKCAFLQNVKFKFDGSSCLNLRHLEMVNALRSFKRTSSKAKADTIFWLLILTVLNHLSSVN